jgi:hypothetical protein
MDLLRDLEPRAEADKHHLQTENLLTGIIKIFQEEPIPQAKIYSSSTTTPTL